MLGDVNDDDAQFFKHQAERCRWLAKDSREPKTVQALLTIAKHYEAKAAVLETERPPSSIIITAY